MLKLVDHVSEEFGQTAGLDEDAIHSLAIAVREAVVNGIKHGNGCDEGKRVRIDYTLAGDGPSPRVVIRVCDQGRGFDVQKVPDPLAPENVSATGGRGVFMMRSFMDDLHVGPATGGGTEVVMTKVITRVPSGS
jgi:serine/threonine-protein kinase RsbW